MYCSNCTFVSITCTCVFGVRQLIIGNEKSKVGFKNLEIIHKNREKNLQFFGVNDLKIRRTVFKIKFIKGKSLKKLANEKSKSWL